MARRLADRGAPHGTIVVAGEQTEGRGRRGNRWCSPRRGGLYLTVVLRQGDSGALMPLLNLAAGLAVRESLQEESGISLALKWPNDVLYNGRKLCGILSEARTAGSTVQYLLLGIGVNTGPLAVFEGIPKQGALPAASLDELNTASLCRERIVVHLLCSLLQYLERQQQEGGREQLLETFARHCCSVGQRLRVRSASETFEAWGAGIGPDGSLLVDRNGETLVLRSEEVFQIREAPAIQSGT
ncbi:MAG: biotin--[acetyl-CoA-carboxylase] ligase [Synergistales bacterium]|nr:biotin--[acetyl-CoA-carboxylase] ligase [Synergistales bacterium]